MLPKKVRVTVEVEYANYVIRGRLVDVYKEGLQTYVVVETITNVFIFNMNTVSIDRLRYTDMSNKSIFVYYSKFQIDGFITKLIDGDTLPDSNNIESTTVKVLKNGLGFAVESSEDSFVKEFTGLSNMGVHSKCLTQRFIEATKPDGNKHKDYNNNYRSTTTRWDREPSVLGSLANSNMFKGGVNDENYRKRIGHAANKRGNKGVQGVT